MKLQFLSLRGAIGIWKKMKQDQIEIDFTQLGPGLIAFVGKTGMGKTTIVECLQPYPQFVFRDGKIQDHFRLKDSHKKLKFSLPDGSNYETILLIDALTGAIEGYIYKNGQPFKDENGTSDGKISLYKLQINTILGSPEIFFNSVFSAQKSTGFAGLDSGERRKLFNELYGLQRYEKYKKEVSIKLNGEEGKSNGLYVDVAGIEGEISTLKASLITITKNDVDHVRLNKIDGERTLGEKEALRVIIEEQIDKIKIEISKSEERQKKYNELEEQRADKSQKIIDIDFKKHIEVNAESTKRDIEIKKFDSDNTYTNQINKLTEEKETAEKTADKEETGVRVDIEKAQLVITSEKEKITKATAGNERLDKILKNRETIERKLADKAELSKKTQELLVQQGHIDAEILSLNGIEKGKSGSLKELTDKRTAIEKIILGIQNEINNYTREIENITKDRDEKINRLTEDVSIIDKVPCETEMGKGCQFLMTAFENKKKLPDIRAGFDNRIDEWNRMKNLKADLLKEEEDRKSIVNADIEKLQADINTEITKPIISLSTQKEKVKLDIKDCAGKLAEINKSDWENLKSQLDQAESTKTLGKSIIDAATKMTQEKYSQIAILQNKIANIQKVLADKLASIEKHESSLRDMIDQGKAGINGKYSIQIKNIEENANKDIARIKGEIAEIEIQLLEMEEATDFNAQLKEKTDEEAQITESIETLKKGILQAENDITNMTQQLIDKQLAEDNILAKEAELQFLQREISDYTFLLKAFDKTGIPILKLENSSIEVNQMANELLSMFDSNFRMMFNTTKPTADKKKMKEVFDIEIIDDEGSAELDLKSGGEQAYLETTIQFAIMIAKKKADKKVETSFLDEKDGGLDPEAAEQYFHMITKAHELSGVYQTIIITHRTAMIDMIAQQVRLTPDGIKIINTEQELAA